MCREVPIQMSTVTRLLVGAGDIFKCHIVIAEYTVNGTTSSPSKSKPFFLHTK